jgi:phosphoglycerol transferase MdoB-like AlkP superfamily enzyme
MKKFLGIFGVAAVFVFLVYWFAGHKIYEYAILKFLAIRAEEIALNREVIWQPGTIKAEVPISERPPNIIVILADDLGFNDLTFGGGGVANGAVPTPNIDSLAHEGVTFTNGYANNATCSPSRASVITGRYATRFGFEFTPTPPQFA